MVNPLYSLRELQFQLKDSGARFIFVLDLLYPRVMQALEGTALEKIVVTGIQERLPFPLNRVYSLKLRRERKLPRIPQDSRTMRYSHLLSVPPMEPPVPVDPGRDLALLQYTGGTTGTPKGVMLTHFNLLANCLQIKAWTPPLRVDPATIVGALPFFHAYGMTTVMNYAIMTGARVILFPRFEVGRILKAIHRYRPQLFPGVPTMYVAINSSPGVERFDLRSIEWCISGAAPLPLDVKESFERLTGGRLVEGYGLTEASPVTHANPLGGVQKSGSIGIPVPDTDCRIVSMESGEPLPLGEVGELLVRGPQVMPGYWNQLEETTRVLKDGWLYTGDVARMDEDGYLYIVDRKKEMIIVSGYNVYPREVEEVLYQHPAVREAAAIGIPDSYQGESVKAFVVLKGDAICSAEELTTFCRERLAPYKVPREVEFVSELPKSIIGKVLRRVLAEQEQARRVQGASGQDPEVKETVRKSGV